ncbi:MAG: VWA domain-containing protein [Polyangiaceae bacterium]
MPDPYRTSSPLGGEGSDSPGAPLTLQIASVHPAVRPDADTTTHAVVKIRAAKQPQGAKRPMLSAVLVLDVSGSMQGEPIAQVLRSAERLAEILDDTDRLGIVTFSDGAETRAPEPLSRARKEVARKLAGVSASGGTNIAGGLAQAALAFPKREVDERQLLVLMSDGEPNIGPSTPGELEAQARALRSRELAVSSLGFGAHHHDDILHAIAQGGGGRYTFVPDAKLAESGFIRALGAQLDVVAERVELLLTPGPDVEIVRVLEDPPSAYGAAGLRVTLSDLAVGDELNLVVELRVRGPREPGPLRALTATLTAGLAGTKQAFKTIEIAEILATRNGSIESDPAAHALASIAQAVELRAKARALSDRGSYADAESLLRKAQAIIQATPGFTPGDGTPLGDANETLADEILVAQRRPARQEYEQYKRAARDYADFGTSTASVRAGGKLTDMPPSTRALFDKARAGMVLPKGYLRVLTGPRAGLRVAIANERFVIGRMGVADLSLPDPSVSRQHAMIVLTGGSFWLVDMGSTSGCTHDGKRVTRLRLTDGIEIELGTNRLRYEQE